MKYLKNKLLAAGTVALTLTVSAHATTDAYRFDVSFDGRDIGSHEFIVTQEADTTRVTSKARFDVKLLFVKVYSYFHEASEQWDGDCLTSLASSTDDNGEPFAVSLDSSSMPGECPGSFAYWDLDKLKKPALINSQNGKPVEPDLQFVGEERFADEPSERYRLIAKGVGEIDLWYRASDQRWLGLRTQKGDGALTYRASND